MKGLTLTPKEQTRLKTMNLVLEGWLGVREAAPVLGVSERQAWRILAAYRGKGAAALSHGNRSSRPANKTSEEIRQQIITLARTRYAGLNHTHLAEMLTKNDKVILSRSTVRNILVGAGIPSPRHRRPPRHRSRRERMPQEGTMVQVDGSYHDWLEDRGPWLTLLLAVDDATGTIPYALFQNHEDAAGYFKLIWGISLGRGLPLAMYTDRHAVFQPPHRPSETVEESLSRERGRTQVGRALRELGISQIFARSPEAKGRVERMAGTFQDRLVSELRMAGIKNMDDANRFLWGFLPRFNERFGVPPANPANAYRPVSPDINLTTILCFKHNCKVARDNTVKYKSHTLQLLPGVSCQSHAGVLAEIQDHLDGSLTVCYQGRVIPTREAPPRPGTLRTCNNAWNSSFSILPKEITDNFVCEDDDLKIKVERASILPEIPDRRPTTKQQARWEAVQEAKLRGLSLRAIARELGISRNTVKKHVVATSPIVYPPRVTAG